MNDLHRVLGPRIVGGEDDEVRILGDAFRHDRTFGAVPVSSTTKEGDDPSLRITLEGGDHLFQAIRRMGIIPDDGVIGPDVDHFGATGDPRAGGQPRRHLLGRDPQAQAGHSLSLIHI